MTNADDIDALLVARKAFAGIPRWVVDEKETTVRLVAPILHAEVVGSLALLTNLTRFTDPQRGSAVLLYEGRPVQRISIRPDHPHVNPFGLDVEAAYRGLKLPIGTTRLHAWKNNRSWPRAASDNVRVAQTLSPEPEHCHAALRLFLLVCGIDDDLPSPPWEPRFI